MSVYKFKMFKKHHRLAVGIFFAVGVISLWRGIWQLSDIFLFPEQKILSNLVSVVLGLLIVAGTYYLIDHDASDRL